MGKNLSYTAVGLDRAHYRRRDDAWTAGRLADEKTRIVPVWRGRSLISPGAATIEARNWVQRHAGPVSLFLCDVPGTGAA